MKKKFVIIMSIFAVLLIISGLCYRSYKVREMKQFRDGFIEAISSCNFEKVDAYLNSDTIVNNTHTYYSVKEQVRTVVENMKEKEYRQYFLEDLSYCGMNECKCFFGYEYMDEEDEKVDITWIVTIRKTKRGYMIERIHY